MFRFKEQAARELAIVKVRNAENGGVDTIYDAIDKS